MIGPYTKVADLCFKVANNDRPLHPRVGHCRDKVAMRCLSGSLSKMSLAPEVCNIIVLWTPSKRAPFFF